MVNPTSRTIYAEIEKNNVEKVKSMVESFADIDINNLMETAAIFGSLEIIKYLQSRGAKLRDSLLSFACNHGRLEVVKYVYESEPITSTARQIIALRAAIMFGQLDIVKYFEGRGVNLRIHEEMPLRCAAKYGQLAIVKYLVEEYHADIHVKWSRPIQLAAQYNRINVVKYLIERGADVYANDDHVARWVAWHNNLEFFKYLIENHSIDIQMETLVKNAIHGGLDIVKYLISKGLIMKDCTEALPYAAEFGTLEMVKYIVECGADLKSFGYAAIEAAINAGKLNVLKYLIDTTEINIHSRSVAILKCASLSGRLDVVKYLVEECHVKIYTKSICGKPEIIAYLNSHMNARPMKYLHMDLCVINLDTVDAMSKEDTGSEQWFIGITSHGSTTSLGYPTKDIRDTMFKRISELMQIRSDFCETQLLSGKR